jgi:hypothetical protein
MPKVKAVTGKPEVGMFVTGQHWVGVMGKAEVSVTALLMTVVGWLATWIAQISTVKLAVIPRHAGVASCYSDCHDEEVDTAEYSGGDGWD